MRDLVLVPLIGREGPVAKGSAAPAPPSRPGPAGVSVAVDALDADEPSAFTATGRTTVFAGDEITAHKDLVVHVGPDG